MCGGSTKDELAVMMVVGWENEHTKRNLITCFVLDVVLMCGTIRNNVCPCFSLSTVDADEIKRLGKRFKKLDLDNSGSLSVEEFMSLPELQQNPLVQRVIDIFDTDGNGEVDFKGLRT